MSAKRMIEIRFYDGSVTTLFIKEIAPNQFRGRMCHPKFGKSYDQHNTWIDGYPRVELLEDAAYHYALDRVGPIIGWKEFVPGAVHDPAEALQTIIDVEFHDGQILEIPITHEAGGQFYNFEIHHDKFRDGVWKDGYPLLGSATAQAYRAALRIGRIVRFEERITEEER